MWELDCEQSWVRKNWCFWSVVLEKTLESPLDCKEIQPVHSEGDQPWVFFGRNDPKAETPILWPPHVKSWLIGKDSYAGRDWGQEEKGTPEDEMARWHHWLDRHKFEWTLGVGDGQGVLVVLQFMGSQRVRHDWVTELNWPVHSVGRIQWAFVLLHFFSPRPNLPVTPGISWLLIFASWSPVINRTSFLVLVLGDLLGLNRTDQFQLLQHQ